MEFDQKKSNSMDSIKERLKKLANERKERSRNMFNQASSELDKASSSSTIQTSSDSDGIKECKMATSSCLGGDKLQSSNEEPPPLAEKKPLKSWKSESEINPEENKQQKRPKMTRTISSSVQQPAAEGRHRERDQSTKQKNTRERTTSNSSTTSTGIGGHIRVKGKVYRLFNIVGRGGTSVVYQAFSEYHNRCVAIKVVNLSHADELVRRAYENEIQLLEQLQESPYVIRMYDYEVLKKRMYVVLECGDIDLAAFMQNKADQIDDKFIKYHWQEMLKCVQVIHDKNIVHSDLKPANFLFVGASLKLIDFGIASNIPSNKTSVVKDVQVGTLNYISPEAITGSYTDSKGHQIYKIPLKSDVWSLGCILYAMVYGRTPFQHITNQLAKINAISSDQHAIEFPKSGKVRDRLLVDVLKKCLVRDVKSRASIEQLLRHPYLRDASVTTPSPGRPAILAPIGGAIPQQQQKQANNNREKENAVEPPNATAKRPGGLKVIK